MSSTIEWLARPGTKPESWNPVTGCTKVSAGCKHCYAETIAGRFWATQFRPVLRDDPSRTIDCVSTSHHERMLASGEARPRCFTDVMCHEDRLALPLKWRTPRTCFVNSMSDLFHADVPDEFIDRVFAVMALCPQHAFVVLTKRPERMRAYLAWSGRLACVVGTQVAMALTMPGVRGVTLGSIESRAWPLPNAWLGVSVEDQPTADQRIPLLLQTPAAVRVVSYEPCIGYADMSKWLIGDKAYERGRASVPSVLEHRSVLDRQTRTGLETPEIDCGQPGGDAAVLEEPRGSAGRAFAVGRLSDCDVLGRPEEAQGVRSQSGVDVDGSSRHPTSDAGEPQERQPGRRAPVKSGDGDGFREHEARYSSSRQEGQAAVGRGERGVQIDRRAGCQDTSIVGADVPVEDRRDVRREAGDSLVGHSSEKLGAYRLTPRIDWLIVGGESGLKARSCHVEWIRSVVKQCQGAGVPCFVKQLGAVISDDNADEWPNPRSLASPMWQYPDGLVRRATLSLKGNDPAEWPESLRVREWPEVRA